MAKLLDKMLNFVGWEAEDEDIIEEEQNEGTEKEELSQPQVLRYGMRKSANKVVNIHSSNQLKVVIAQPQSIDDAQDVCDHLKNKKPVIVNLEDVDKDTAQRIVDFLSGAVYGVDGNIQKVANSIFVIAPSNVDIMGNYKDEFNTKAAFPWIK